MAKLLDLLENGGGPSALERGQFIFPIASPTGLRYIATMTAPLRHLAAFVDEHEPGEFYWVLAERNGDATWTTVGASGISFGTWAAAWRAGCAAVYNAVSDIKAGPRSTDEFLVNYDEGARPRTSGPERKH